MPETNDKTTNATATAASEEPTPGRLQVFVNNHPRAAKVVAIAGAVTAAAGVAHFARTVSANRQHLAAASDAAKEALNEVAASTSPTDADA